MTRSALEAWRAPRYASDMLRSLALFTALLCSPAFAQEALPPLPPEVRAEFTAVGRFGQAGFKRMEVCTATLIAPDLALTAAHCVSSSGKSDRVFVAGWDRGSYAAFSKSALEIRHPDFGIQTENIATADIALVALETPIADPAPLPLAAPGSGLEAGEVALLGYHRNTPHLLSGDLACPARPFENGLIRVDCPVVGGNSGGPVLRKTAPGWEIIGVVSARHYGTAVVVALPPWLYEAIESHKAK